MLIDNKVVDILLKYESLFEASADVNVAILKILQNESLHKDQIADLFNYLSEGTDLMNEINDDVAFWLYDHVDGTIHIESGSSDINNDKISHFPFVLAYSNLRTLSIPKVEAVKGNYITDLRCDSVELINIPKVWRYYNTFMIMNVRDATILPEDVRIIVNSGMKKHIRHMADYESAENAVVDFASHFVLDHIEVD